MIKIIKIPTMVLIAIIASQNIANAQQARRDDGGSARIINKLQAMVREMTAERDKLKAENEKMSAEIESLKQEKDAAVSAEEKLSGELAAQRDSNEAVRGRLDQTHAKLLEVVEKYKTLNQEKNQLSLEHAELQKQQEFTVTELDSCEGKNIKMYQATREILDNYRGQGLFTRLVQSEPIFQFNSVEVENIIQEYEDKLIEQQYKRKDEPDAPFEEAETAGETE